MSVQRRVKDIVYSCKIWWLYTCIPGIRLCLQIVIFQVSILQRAGTVEEGGQGATASHDAGTQKKKGSGSSRVGQERMAHSQPVWDGTTLYGLQLEQGYFRVLSLLYTGFVQTVSIYINDSNAHWFKKTKPHSGGIRGPTWHRDPEEV